MDLFYIIVFVAGVAVGAATGTFWARHKASRIRDKETLENNQLVLELRSQKESYQLSLAEAEVRLTEERRHMEEKLTLLSNTKEQIRNDFSVLAAQLLEEKAKTFSQHNKESLETLLVPLREQIGEFKRRIEDVHLQQETGRAALVNEIKNLSKMSIEVSQNANNLADALKGDNKATGTWGEMVLERVLEVSGLCRGREYETQFQTHDSEGNRAIPDAVVRLPHTKYVVVDSKVSLAAYERYCASTTPEEQEEALKLHVQSIRQHIKNLSDKKYDELPEIRSLDYTIMFIAIEGAFAAALKAEPNLFAEAFSKNIILCSPSSLLAVLKTIAYTWKIEHQTKNVQDIAKKAGDLYDKFCGFLATLEQIGLAIQKAGEQYDNALKTLSTGKGSIIKRAEQLRTLGANGKKQIPRELLEQADAIEEPLVDEGDQA